MKTTLSILIILIIFNGCKTETKCSDIKKPVDLIEGLSELNSMLSDRIESLAYRDYYEALKTSTDTVDITKRNFAYHLYKANESIDSLSKNLKRKIISKITSLNKNQQDTISVSLVLNSFSDQFSKGLISDASIQSTFEQFKTYQNKIDKIKADIIKGQKGKGSIVCREVGHKIQIEDLNNINDFWDLFCLIERTRYTLSKDILCTFSNLSCYNKELTYTYSTQYDGSPNDVNSWVAKDKK